MQLSAALKSSVLRAGRYNVQVAAMRPGARLLCQTGGHPPTCECLQRTGHLGLAPLGSAVQPRNAHVLLAGSLLGLDQPAAHCRAYRH